MNTKDIEEIVKRVVDEFKTEQLVLDHDDNYYIAGTTEDLESAVRVALTQHHQAEVERAREEERENIKYWIKERSEIMAKMAHCQKDSLCWAKQERTAKNLLGDFKLFLQAITPTKTDK